MEDILEPKKLKIYIFLGGIGHYIVYNLDKITIMNESLFWIFNLVPSILVTIYIINNLELLKDKSYTDIEGYKLKMLQLIISLACFIFSFLIAGWLMTLTVLGSNYLTKNSTKDYLTFDIIDRYQAKANLRKRSRKRVEVVRFTDGQITDKIELNRVDYIKDNKVILKGAKGCFGYYVIDQ